MNIFGSPDIERMAAEHDYNGLYPLLNHRDRLVRLEAARALADMNDGTGWRFLIDTLRQEGDIESRTIAAAMLGELGHPRAVPVLREVLLKQRYAPANEELAEAIHEALETIGTPEADEALRDAGYEPVLKVQSHTVIEYDTRYVKSVLPSTEKIQFLTAEQHLNNAVEMREAEQTERGLVEDSLAIWLSPHWAYAWYLRGVLFEDLERNLEALLAYQWAVELDPTQHDAREAMAELEKEVLPPPEDLPTILSQINMRDWRMRRDMAALLGDRALRNKISGKDSTGALVGLLSDEEREVRHAAIEALGRLGEKSAVPALLELEESSWLVRFAVIQALARLESVDGLIGVLRKEMVRFQERNPVFSSNKDPMLEVEYTAMMEIGIRALESTGDIEALLSAAEGNVWEESEEEDSDSAWSPSGESFYQPSSIDLPLEEELDEEEPEEDLTSYVDEVAEMVVMALDRLASPKISSLDTQILERLAEVPDLTLMDVTGEQEEPALVYDLSALRQAAQDELDLR